MAGSGQPLSTLPPYVREMQSSHRERSRSSSSERLPRGVEEITEKDFFLKNDEFRLWLKDEKDKVV